MKKIHIVYLFIILFVFFPACAPHADGTPKQVCFSERCYNVEVAQTQLERFKGLQNRESLGKDAGMLFVFEESKRHSFWMKDTLLPLDIIWLDQKKRVVTISPNIQPCQTEQCPVYAPDQAALYVLELNAGETFELGLKVGAKVTFQ